MEPTTELGYTAYNIGMMVIAVALFALFATLVVGGVIGYRKSRDAVERAFAVLAMAGGAAILATIVLTGMELLPEALFWILLFVELGLLSMLFWIWMLIECATKEPNEGNDKLVWVIIIVFTHVLGAALYLFVRSPRRVAEQQSK